MSVISEAPNGLHAVEGILNYLQPTAEKPYQYTYDPPPGHERTNYAYQGHPVPVWDARPIAPQLSLDREGFALVKAPTATSDFYDEDALRQAYYRETERLVARETGAARVVIFDHTIRRRLAGVEDRSHGQPRQPVPRVHNDYTEVSGPQRVRDVLPDEAEALLKKRFAVINIWRPIRGPLYDSPLALADARSVAKRDFIASDLIYPDRTGETYSVAFNPAHRWFYFRAMGTDEVVLIKVYDSAENVARFTAHAAFDDPTTPPDAVPRESIELRSLVFWD